MINLPNALTLMRFALAPVIALQMLRHAYGVALVLFLVSAVSDLVDGTIARHWNLRTRFGEVADPVADKLTMLTVAMLLALEHALPWWLAGAIVVRDLVIVGGALAYRRFVGPVEMAPSLISKLNTGLEFLLLLLVLAQLAGLLPDGAWRPALIAATLSTIVLSGAHYVLVWSRKAARQRTERPRAP